MNAGGTTLFDEVGSEVSGTEQTGGAALAKEGSFREQTGEVPKEKESFCRKPAYLLICLYCSILLKEERRADQHKGGSR